MKRIDPELVFVVDDQPLLLQVAEEVLLSQGFKLRKFDDPLAAREAFLASDPLPCLFISDYAMPGLNGIDLLKQCKEICPSLKTLLLSGTVDEDILRDAPVQVDKFLSKPCTMEVLASTVATVLGRQLRSG